MLDRFRSGDNEAFESLVALYSEALFHFIYTIVNDHHEAKHLMVESFALLALSNGHYAGKSSLKTYLYKIGQNHARRYVRMRRRDRHISFEEVEGVLAREEDSPHSIIERKADRELLFDAMRDLREDHCMVIRLLYFEDHSYSEAGRIMSKSVVQIRNLAYRAKMALKKILESNGYTYY